MDQSLQSALELQLAAYSAELHAFLEGLPGRFYPAIPLSRRLLAAGLAALAGAVAELFSERLDDNLTVPIAAALAAAILI